MVLIQKKSFIKHYTKNNARGRIFYYTGPWSKSIVMVLIAFQVTQLNLALNFFIVIILSLNSSPGRKGGWSLAGGCRRGDGDGGSFPCRLLD